MNTHPILPSVAFSALLATLGHAAITLEDTVFLDNSTGSTEDTDGNSATRTVTTADLGTFNANGYDKLVVALGGEGTGDNTVTSVTYGGVAMTKVVDAYGGNRGSSIWYLDNVSVTGEFVITHAVDQKAIGFAAYGLNGTAAGFNQAASTSQSTGTTGYMNDMTMSVSTGDFMVMSFARNNLDNSHDGSGGRPAGTAFDNTTQLYYGFRDGDTAASGYYTVQGSDGSSFTPMVYDLTNGAGRLTAATFSAIPEPGSFVLLGLSGLLVLRRRR